MSDKRTAMQVLADAGLLPLGETSPPASSGTVSDESLESYQSYRRSLLEVAEVVEELADDFTNLDFDYDREIWFQGKLADIANSLEEAADVRNRFFNERYTLTEGGDS